MKDLPNIHNIIDMITQRNKQIKEKFPATLHFHLHGATPLKCLATSNDQGEIMSAEPRIRIRRVVIGIPRATQDGCDLDSTLQTLFPKSKALELLESVLLCRAIYDCVLQKVFSHAGNIACGFDATATTGIFWVGRSYCRVFEFPRVSALIVDQAGVIVALLQRCRSVSTR